MSPSKLKRPQQSSKFPASNLRSRNMEVLHRNQLSSVLWAIVLDSHALPKRKIFILVFLHHCGMIELRRFAHVSAKKQIARRQFHERFVFNLFVVFCDFWPVCHDSSVGCSSILTVNILRTLTGLLFFNLNC